MNSRIDQIFDQDGNCAYSKDWGRRVTTTLQDGELVEVPFTEEENAEADALEAAEVAQQQVVVATQEARGTVATFLEGVATARARAQQISGDGRNSQAVRDLADAVDDLLAAVPSLIALTELQNGNNGHGETPA